MKLTWQKIKTGYTRENLLAGAGATKICVARVWYDAITSEKNKWTVSFLLPGLVKKMRDNYPNPKLAKEAAKLCVEMWFSITTSEE